MLVQEGLSGLPQLGWESDDLNLVLQVPQTLDVRTVRVQVDVLKALDDSGVLLQIILVCKTII